MHRTDSPQLGDNYIEQLIQAKEKTAARVRPSDIDEAIKSIFFFTARDAVKATLLPDLDTAEQLGLLTFCVIVLKNGFTVTGESACASPENFDEEIGRRIALDNAKNKIWPLLGYALKSQLAQRALDDRAHAGYLQSANYGGTGE